MAVALAACGGSTISNPRVASSAASPSPCILSPSPSPLSTPTNQENSYGAMISQGQTLRRKVIVDPQQHTFAVQIAWNQGDVQITLTAPSGRVYDRTTTDPAAHHHVQANAESFAIDQPEPGQWTVELFGARINGSPESVRVDITLIPMADFGPIAYASAEPDRGVAPIAIQFTATANAFEGG